MNRIMKRGFALVMALVLCLGVLSGISVEASAVTPGMYNWGIRGNVASTLSPAAEAFYADNNTSYDLLAALDGTSNLSAMASSELYQELQELMKSNHTHTTSYNETREQYQYTDCQGGGGKISSFYSGKEIGPAWDSGSTWNREHTWPNSKGLGGADENDIMMLRPTYKNENGSRSNTAYGESAGYYHPNSESNGAYDVRGDVARIFLYVYVRWGNVNGNGAYSTWGTNGVMESKEVLLKWMAADPVDTWELGRNDVVETITGTRNVFVDYPELAFLLFNEAVPTGMVTPSGEAAGSSTSYTVTAVSNNDAYGTVSVSGKVITAAPAAGHYISGYSVTSGTATVQQSGNTFVVNAESDCTVQINFAAKATTSVIFFENGTLASNRMVYAGDSIVLPGHTTALPEGYTFLGWSAAEVADTTDLPTCQKAGNALTVNGDTTLYAIYSYAEEVSSGAESYVLVTDAGQLYEGATVVIAASNANYALSTTQNSNNRGAATITKNSDHTISWTSNVQELTLGAGTTDGTYSFHTGSKGYLYCASTSSKNYLRTQTTLDAKASFTITVSSNGVSKIVSKTTSSTRNQMRYNTNSGNPIFACYASGQQDLSLYIKTIGSGSVTHYTTGAAPTCAHVNTTAVDGKAATCTENGWTDGLYCNDCQTYVNGHEIAYATGHATATWMNAVAGTCTTNGIAGHWHCDVCGCDYAEKTAASPALSAAALNTGKNPDNHDADTEIRDAVEATCTAAGYSGDTWCLGCETKIGNGQEMPMADHEVNHVDAKDPTHADEGNIAHFACTVCGQFFGDEAATQKLAKEDVVIPALGHDFGEFQKDANKHWKECSCGEKSEEGDHTYGEWTVVTAATQTAKGCKERTCTACGHKQMVEIPPVSSPNTGDNSQIGLWIAVLAVCGLAIAALIIVPVVKKRKA